MSALSSASQSVRNFSPAASSGCEDTPESISGSRPRGSSSRNTFSIARIGTAGLPSFGEALNP